jgi:hypothetical protein
VPTSTTAHTHQRSVPLPYHGLVPRDRPALPRHPLEQTPGFAVPPTHHLVAPSLHALEHDPDIAKGQPEATQRDAESPDHGRRAIALEQASVVEGSLNSLEHPPSRLQWFGQPRQAPFLPVVLTSPKLGWSDQLP